jgi:tRNA 2-thiouridine synthesizing protein A
MFKMDSIDVRGLSCPLPVIRVKKAIDKGIKELQVIGSSQVSLENVQKFASSQGFKLEKINQTVNEWNLTIRK